MSAQYTVVRYVPDPIAEEAVNIGVITWDQDRIHCRFLENWTRVKSFGNENIDFLRDFAKEITASTSRQLPLRGVNSESDFSVDALDKMVNNWSRSIQFTAPRGSTKDSVSLLSDIAPLFLRQPRRARGHARSRLVAARQAAAIMLDAVRRRVPDAADRLVKTREVVDGVVEQHRLDVALANGHLLAGVQAISFEITAGEHLEKEVLSAKWTLSDIRQKLATVPMAVFTYPPPGTKARSAYRDARHAFDALRAEVITTPEVMAQWANERARAIQVAQG